MPSNSLDDTLSKELIDFVFAPQGILARSYTSYEERPAQKAMAQQILEAYEKKQIALVEGGTGTGKSLAYLTAAVLWAARNKERTVISTHTIALQHQLIEKDLPLLLKTLDLDIEAVIVKGMNNYLCWKRLEEKEEEVTLFSGQEEKAVHHLRLWAEKSVDGTRSSLSFSLPPGTWESVGAEREHCTHVQCPFYKKCFFFKARKAAEEAQILVVNHHLLLLDSLDKDENEDKERNILPDYSRLIIDEAHHLEDIALDILAVYSSKREILTLLAQLLSERQDHLGSLQKIHRQLSQQSAISPSLIFRLETEIPSCKAELVTKLAQAFMVLENKMQEQLRIRRWRLQAQYQQDPHWQTSILPAFDALIEDLKKITAILRSFVADLPLIREDKQLPVWMADVVQTTERLEVKKNALHSFFHPDAELHTEVRWIERENDHQVAIVCADLDVAARLSKTLFAPLDTVVLCSATLRGGADFALVRHRLGIASLENHFEITEGIYSSPFDFASRVLFAIPKDLPDPASFCFLQEAGQLLMEILRIAEGGAFVLFTSYEMLQQFYRELQPKLEKLGFSLFRQGDEERTQLLQHFRKATKGVLFGTDSFWEGVDIAGEALRCVVIVKLPFQVPNDPIVEAQHEAIVKEGGNPFYDLTIPKAAMKFKQGFGRLMRRKEDWGCVVCLDPRLLSKGYGKHILNSLPMCKNSFADRQTVLNDLRLFFNRANEGVSDDIP